MLELTYKGILIGLKGSGARYLRVNTQKTLKNSDDRRLYQQLRRRGIPVSTIDSHFANIRSGAFTSAYLSNRYNLSLMVNQ